MTNNVVNASKWAIVSQVIKLIIKFLLNIWLAKLVAPSDFGLISIVTIIINILAATGELGLVASIIQKREITNKQLSSVFWLNVIIGLCITVLLFLSSDLIARFYHKPQLTSIIKVISLCFLFNAFMLTHNAILIKNLSLKRFETYALISVVFSGLVALILAYFDFGIWALVMQQNVLFFTNAALVWIFETWRPMCFFSFREIKSLVSYGTNIFLSTILNTILSSLDILLIGRVYSNSSVGYYSFAQNLIIIPITALSGAVTKVLFPVMAKLQDDELKMKESYAIAITIVNLMVLPALSTIIVFTHFFISFFLGSEWLGAVVYIQLFCIISMFLPVSVLNLNILLVKGRSDKFLHLEIVKKIILVIGLLITINIGLKAVAIGVLITTCISFFLNLYYSGKVSGYKIKMQLIDLYPVFLITVAYTIVLILVKMFLESYLPQYLNAIFGLILGVGVFILLVKKYMGNTARIIQSLLYQIVNKK